MIILTNVKQINDKINKIFSLENNSLSDDDFSFINDIIDERQIAKLISNTPQIDIIKNERELEDLSLLIFQLKDYIPALCNLTNCFLLSKNYDAVYFFTTKLFITHVGNINYSSHGDYSYKERYFDRFIEIIKNCNISKENYLPFLLYIFKDDKVGGVELWRGPCLEYMQVFYNENKEFFLSCINNQEFRVQLLFLVSKFNTQKAISLLFEFIDANQPQDEILEIFKSIKKETFLYIDKIVSNCDALTMDKIYIILSSFQDDSEAKTRLNDVFKYTTNRDLRNLLANKLGISENSGIIKNEKQFLFAVRRNIKETDQQERVFNLAFEKCNLTFKSGLKCDFACYTYFLNIFKSDKNLLNLYKYDSLKEVFEEKSLNDFISNLFTELKRKEDIKACKWLVRLICLLNKDSNELFEFVTNLYEQDKHKQAKYMLECLMACKREEILPVLKKLKKFDSFDSQFFFDLIIEFYNYDKSKICDYMIEQNCDVENERKRMFEEFISNRMFSQEYFDLYIKLPIISKLVENLIFGEYKFEKLYNAFIIKDGERKYLVGSRASDCVISIIFTQDIDERFKDIVDYFQNPTFKQFEKVEYNAKNFDRSLSKVTSFAGMIVSFETFRQRLEEYGFNYNREVGEVHYNSLLSIFKPLDIACEIEFENNLQNSHYATISNVYFYKLNQLLKSNGKYLTQKQNAMSINNLPNRYFAYIMTKILESAKST